MITLKAHGKPRVYPHFGRFRVLFSLRELSRACSQPSYLGRAASHHLHSVFFVAWLKIPGVRAARIYPCCALGGFGGNSEAPYVATASGLSRFFSLASTGGPAPSAASRNWRRWGTATVPLVRHLDIRLRRSAQRGSETRPRRLARRGGGAEGAQSPLTRRRPVIGSRRRPVIGAAGDPSERRPLERRPRGGGERAMAWAGVGRGEEGRGLPTTAGGRAAGRAGPRLGEADADHIDPAALEPRPPRGRQLLLGVQRRPPSPAISSAVDSDRPAQPRGHAFFCISLSLSRS